MHHDPKARSRLAAAEEVPSRQTSSCDNTAVFPGAADCTVLLADWICCRGVPEGI